MTVAHVVVCELIKNSRETLKITLSEYHGHPLADLRIYAPVPGADVLCPTKKGVSIRVDMLDDVIAGLMQAKAQAAAMGWTGGDA